MASFTAAPLRGLPASPVGPAKARQTGPQGPAASGTRAYQLLGGESGGSDGSVPVAGAVGNGLDRTRAVVGGVQGELLSGFCLRPEVLCAQADGADAGALEGEEVVQLVGGGGERSGVGR